MATVVNYSADEAIADARGSSITYDTGFQLTRYDNLSVPRVGAADSYRYVASSASSRPTSGQMFPRGRR